MTIETVLDRVRISSQRVVESSDLVKISNIGIETFADWLATHVEDVRVCISDAVVGFPLRFNSTSDEVNFVCILMLINMGSGYCKELRESCDRDPYETILWGVLAMHIGGQALDAHALVQLSTSDVQSLFNIPTHVEREHVPGIRVMEPGPLCGLVNSIHTLLVSSSKRLLDAGYTSLGDFVTQVHTEDPTAATMVERLMSVLPDAFADVVHDWHDCGRIVIAKKAQLLVAELSERFPTLFSFNDIQDLTITADNVIPAMLHAHGVIVIDDELLHCIESGTTLTDDDVDRPDIQLRCAAIVACDQLCLLANVGLQSSSVDNNNSINSNLTIRDIDLYLRRTASKDDEYKHVKSFAYVSAFY